MSKESVSIESREEMAAKGVHIFLALPNGTAATAEMDQQYSKFKPRCSKSNICVAGVKMANRAAARRKWEESTKRRKGDSVAIDEDLDESNDESDDDNDYDTPPTKKRRGTRSVCNVSL